LRGLITQPKDDEQTGKGERRAARGAERRQRSDHAHDEPRTCKRLGMTAAEVVDETTIRGPPKNYTPFARMDGVRPGGQLHKAQVRGTGRLTKCTDSASNRMAGTRFSSS